MTILPEAFERFYMSLSHQPPHFLVVDGLAGAGKSILPPFWPILRREIRIVADPSKPLPLAGTVYDPRRYRRP